MKNQNILASFLLIGIGLYFLLRQLQLPFLTDFFSWPTLLMILGIVFLLYSYVSKAYKNLFSGALLLGLGLHFFGLQHYNFWIDNWGIYLFIIGSAFLIRFQKTRKGLIPGLTLAGLSLFIIFWPNLPAWLIWIDKSVELIETFWPVLLLVTGSILLLQKK